MIYHISDKKWSMLFITHDVVLYFWGLTFDAKNWCWASEHLWEHHGFAWANMGGFPISTFPDSKPEIRTHNRTVPCGSVHTLGTCKCHPNVVFFSKINRTVSFWHLLISGVTTDFSQETNYVLCRVASAPRCPSLCNRSWRTRAFTKLRAREHRSNMEVP